MAAETGQFFCDKCKKTMAATKFFTYKNGSKSELCKSCLTMHVNNWEPETYTWILKQFDVPYIPEEWNIIRDREYQKDPYKMNGMSVVGRYLSKMKLKQWKGYTWADSEKLQKKAETDAQLYGTPKELAEQRLAEMKEKLENGEISEAQYLTYAEIQKPAAADMESPYVDGAANPNYKGSLHSPYPLNDNPFVQVELPNPLDELTEEDKLYLAMKWGQLYSANDWVSLEKLYKEYENSFDLHNADLIAGTVQLCKLDLKCNQALDSGDIDSYSKLARASDSLRKSLKFTEAQRKEDKSTEFSCYGQLVAYAEMKKGAIPRINFDIDRDIVDEDIRDIKAYNKSLIDEDPAIFKLIEQYIKKRDAAAQQEADLAEAKARGEDYVTLTDEDLKEYNDSFNDNYDEEEDE